MKRFLLSLVLAISLALTSCSEPFDDSAIWEQLDEHSESIRDHEQRISALEELCKQMNTNISSLQAIVEALQNNDYVTSVVPIIKDGEVVGYTITFTKSEPITIYHGEDGKDGANGADGKDGYTPQIGVKQDTDGIYYWTLDGDWLLDASGNKIKAVGTDGKDGQDGKDGADGITPQLKIENNYWYVSYDNGATWTQLGKATGEDGNDGQNGTNGKDGDSFFQSVTQDDDFVYFTLADGTIITLPKYKAEEANENCKIYYTTSDGKKMFPKTDASLYGAILISNTYKDGQGVLTFDDAVISIGSYAFAWCDSLTSITIPDSVTSIGWDAFDGCSSLTSITIPDSVTEIGNDAFRDCTSLTSVTIPDSVTEIGYNAFYGCTGELIVNCNIPSASEFSYGAFYASKFTKVTIGEGVTSIGSYAFQECSSLTSVTIPDSVTSIGSYAFAWCDSLTSITIPDSVTSIGWDAFAGCTSLTSVTIGNSVTSIGDLAFAYCTSLTSVSIPDSVTSIGDWAFSDCTSLTSVTIGNSVTSIGNSAFCGCSSLTSVTIGNSVTSIGDYTFQNCASLKEVYCKPTTPPTGGRDMFSYYSWGLWMSIGCKIYVPVGSGAVYKAALGWSTYASDIIEYNFETGEIVQPVLYYEKCGDDVEKITTSSGSTTWPWSDQFTGWTPEGDAASNIVYSGKHASVRHSGANYQPTPDAVGVSGAPYVFVNRIPAEAYFVIENITVAGGSNYIFTFNVSCQNGYNDGTPTFAEVTNSIVHLELGYDGANWDEVDCIFSPNGGNGWYAATTEFKVAANATKLYARFTYGTPVQHGARFDDFKLIAGGNGVELAPEVAEAQPAK